MSYMYKLRILEVFPHNYFAYISSGNKRSAAVNITKKTVEIRCVKNMYLYDMSLIRNNIFVNVIIGKSNWYSRNILKYTFIRVHKLKKKM